MNIWGGIFARYYDSVMQASEEHGLSRMRGELLARARGRTLEIGAGTGLNLAHYPEAVGTLTLCEPEEPMARRLRSAAAGRDATVLVAPAEALPVPDGSVDTVVSTLVLCTVRDPAAAVAEIRRVLAPGGQLLFLEHVRSPDDPELARRQDRWDPAWKRVGHGCRCNRSTVTTLRDGGLRVEHESTYIPKAPSIVRPAVMGAALLP